MSKQKQKTVRNSILRRIERLRKIVWFQTIAGLNEYESRLAIRVKADLRNNNQEWIERFKLKLKFFKQSTILLRSLVHQVIE